MLRLEGASPKGRTSFAMGQLASSRNWSAVELLTRPKVPVESVQRTLFFAFRKVVTVLSGFRPLSITEGNIMSSAEVRVPSPKSGSSKINVPVSRG